MATRTALATEPRAEEAAGRLALVATPFGPFVAVLLITAAIGYWAAYDRQAAGQKLILLVAAAALYYAIAHLPARRLPAAGDLLAAGGVLVAAYFLLTYDWRAQPSEFGPINALARPWLAIRPALGVPAMQANVAGSLMAMSVPFLAAAGVAAYRRGRDGRLAAAALGAGFVLFALLLTTSRGAWLALASAGVAVAGWRLLSRAGRRAGPSAAMAYDVAVALIVAMAVWMVVAAPGLMVDLLDRLPGGSSASARVGLGHETVYLIADYPFTGGGLGAFPGHYSQYILHIPVPFLPNGHNIFLDAAFEQGIAGALALAAILLGSLALLAAAARRQPRILRHPSVGPAALAAAASLIVMLVHGQVEDTVYGSGAVVLILVMPGIAVSLSRSAPAERPGRGRWRTRAALAALLLLALAALVQARPLLAKWQANRGAVEMARRELAAWPTGQWVEPGRAPDLRPAAAHFHAALALDPAEPTALYRLGLIAAGRLDFDAAVDYLEAASLARPDHPGISKALALNYVWTGRLPEAAALLRAQPETARELRIYVGWWQARGRPDLAEFAQQALLFL